MARGPAQRTRGPRPAGLTHYPAPTRVPGRLIAVEGLDGSGKSTQARLLLEWLRQAGYPVHLTEWNSSPLIREALRRGKRRRLLTPATFSLMHAADLADRLEHEILPRLRLGGIVLADRWVYTALARDGARGVDPGWVRQLYAGSPRPHLSVYFRVPVDVALGRILAGREALGYYEAGQDLELATDPGESFRLFQERVQAGYEGLVRSDGLRVIDGREPAHKQQMRLRTLVLQVLRRRRGSSGGGAEGPSPARSQEPS